jgi:hypothetical protein
LEEEIRLNSGTFPLAGLRSKAAFGLAGSTAIVLRRRGISNPPSKIRVTLLEIKEWTIQNGRRSSGHQKSAPAVPTMRISLHER